MSVYLISLFRGRLRFLFMIHPVFVFLSSFGFQIPFTEIGVGYTYLNTYKQFVDPTSLSWDIENLFDQIFRQDEGYFGFSKVYVGTLPILWFPKFLFRAPADITVYFSLSIFTLFCTAIAVNVSLFHRVIRKDVLLVIALYLTVSPTFFDINSTLHRYTLLCLGLFLFLIAYIGLTRKFARHRPISLILTLSFAIILIGISKPPIFLSILLFMILDGWVRDKLPILSSFLLKLGSTRFVMYPIIFLLGSAFFSAVAPEEYTLGFSQRGGQYTAMANVPGLGLVVRVVYAMLSPFPWTNFRQMQLYGFNSIFLFVHMLSSFLASWMVITLVLRGNLILRGRDDIRTSAIFGVAVISSLAFSAIGFHVYLAPALPFLAPLLLDKVNRISVIYPIGFLIFFEVIARAAQIL
ncbi:MAG: hypothetical protein NUV80_06265 [Candidatus Berkelbacteria bacterium]|nr:hypothetical protein [Candidatus Berkelbacteria bacterium]